MVTDRILLTNPLKIATFLRLGSDVGKFDFVNTDGKEYRWLEDTYVAESVVVTTGLASAATTTSFTPASLTYLQPGDLLKVEDEIMWVSSVDTGIPQVTRGWGATTGVTHANLSVAYHIGRARIDGDAADASESTEVTSSTNYTQIYQRTVEVARTKQKMAQYGISDPMGREVDKKMDELLITLNKLPYFGERYIGTNAALARSAGGMKTYITDNTSENSSASLTRPMLDSLLRDIYADGGEPDLILTGAVQQQKINDMYEGFVMTDRVESVGGIKINQLMNPITGGMIDILVDRACPADELYVLQSSELAFYAFDPFFFEDLAKVGDAEVGEVVGEYGFVCRSDKWHGYLGGLSTS
jgi:hypothetical protein